MDSRAGAVKGVSEEIGKDFNDKGFSSSKLLIYVRANRRLGVGGKLRNLTEYIGYWKQDSINLGVLVWKRIG